MSWIIMITIGMSIMTNQNIKMWGKCVLEVIVTAVWSLSSRSLLEGALKAAWGHQLWLPQDMVLEGRLLEDSGGPGWVRGQRRAMHPEAAACYGVLLSGRDRGGRHSGGAWGSFILKTTGKEMWIPGAICWGIPANSPILESFCFYVYKVYNVCLMQRWCPLK